MGYVHGYSEYEAGRLRNSAQALSGLLHANVRYPDGALVLEAPCGVGAQTEFLLANSPVARLLCMDISPESVDYINAHGTSTPLNDKMETNAIKAALGDCARSVMISSSNSMTAIPP